MIGILRFLRLLDARAPFRAFVRKRQQSRSEADALRDVLGKRDDRLLRDAGTDRATALRSVKRTPTGSRRDWDRWQI